MKILASGDHHFYKHSRFDEAKRVHGWMVDLAREEKVDVFCSGGDVYQRESCPEEREAVKAWLLRMTDICPSVISKGNHEIRRDLQILASLRSRHPIIVEEGAGVHYVAGAAIAAMAWPELSGLLALLGDKATADMATRQALQAVLRGLGQQLEQHDGPRILLGHFLVDGSRVSETQTLEGLPINVGLTDLALARAHLGLMAHVHLAQAFDVFGAPHHYVGSPFRDTFGQLEKKTVLLAEFDGQRLVSVREIETPATRMLQLTGEWAERILLHDDVEVANAEVDVIYDVPVASQRAAKADEESLRRNLIERGAVNVKIRPQVKVEKRSRMPEISLAKTVVEKLPFHWKNVGFDPAERRAPLLAKCAELEAAVGGLRSSRGKLAPRLASCHFHNFGPFDDYTLDLRPHADKPLIALVAKNGTGKTCAVETAGAGVNYGRMPNQGSLLSRARAKDTYVERDDGQGYVIRHNIDGVNRKHLSTIVKGPDGKPVYERTGWRDFEKWADENLISEDVLMACVHTAQGFKGMKSSFINLTSSDRISVLLQVIGVERIEKMATAAGENSRELLKKIAALTTRIADATEGAPNLDAVLAELAAARQELSSAEARVTGLRTDLVTLEAQDAARTELERQANAARATRERIEAELAAAQGRVLELCRRYEAADPRGAQAAADGAEQALTAARAALVAAEEASRVADADHAAAVAAGEARAKLEAEVETARAAAALLAARVDKGRSVIERAEAIRAAGPRLDAARAELATLDAKIFESTSAGGRLLQAVAEATSRLAGIDSRIARARETVQGRDAAERAAAALPAAEAEAAAASAAQDAAEAAERALHGQHVAGAEERNAGLRAGIDAAEAANALAPALAARAADDQAVTLAAALPGQIDEGQRAIRAARERRAAADRTLADARAAEARLAAIRSAAEDLAAAEAERDAILAQGVERDAEARRLLEAERAARPAAEALRAEIPGLEKLAAEAPDLAAAEAVAEQRRGELDTANATHERLRAELDALPPAAPLPPPGAGAGRERAAVDAAEATARAAAVAVGAAEATRRELEPQVSAMRLTVEQLTSERAAAPAAPEVPPAVDVAAARAEAERAEKFARDTAADAARIEQRLEQAKASAAKTATLEAERSGLLQDQADWNRLALDLGCDGIQSSEVEGVGPELTEILNDMLHGVVGPRYTATIETKRAKAGGKGETDECRIMVIDSVAGTEKEAKEHSGGEGTTLGNAISLSIMILGCQRAGFEKPSIVLDESSSYLDEESRRHYMPMLRRAAAATGAQNIILISHDREVWSAADAIIEIPQQGPAFASDAASPAVRAA